MYLILETLLYFTYWVLHKMVDILLRTFSNEFSWMKKYCIWFIFQWGLFLGVQLTKRHYCRDHFVYTANQWETTLQCKVVSRWLGAWTKWSLVMAGSHGLIFTSNQGIWKSRAERTALKPKFWNEWMNEWKKNILGLKLCTEAEKFFQTPCKQRFLMQCHQM